MRPMTVPPSLTDHGTLRYALEWLAYTGQATPYQSATKLRSYPAVTCDENKNFRAKRLTNTKSVVN